MEMLELNFFESENTIFFKKKNHSIKKTYAAVVQGKPEINFTYEWQDYLLKPDDNNSKHIYHTVQVWQSDDKNRPTQAKLCITRMLSELSVILNITASASVVPVTEAESVVITASLIVTG